MRAKFLPLLILLTAGCSSPKVWYHPDKSAADAQRDFAQCRMTAAHVPVETGRNMSGLGVFMATQMAHGNFVDACMMEKGYLRVPAKTVTNGEAYPE